MTTLQPKTLASAQDRRAPSAQWSGAQIKAIALGAANVAPLISESDFSRVAPEIDFWDAWPIQDEGGAPARLPGEETLWMALAAPRAPDPDERHSHARIHLVSRGGDTWRDLGPAMPDGFSPGSREWSGSAVLAEDRRRLTLYFTAAGRRGEPRVSFEQRLFRARATLAGASGAWRLEDWRALGEFALRDSDHYMASDAGSGSVGAIKAFRDPAYFRDPANGRHYVFFAGSQAHSTSAYNGVIGAAFADDEGADRWTTLSPLVSADGLNNELERPHIVLHSGLYYLFWSTQAHVFNPDGPVGPTGLYGVVSDRIDGAWKPLNETCLVFANPPEAPRQAYSWLVTPDLNVISFVDDWIDARSQPAGKRFGATFAPTLRLRLDGARAGLAV